MLCWGFLTRGQWERPRAVFVAFMKENQTNLKFVTNTHHSTNVSGKGDSFAQFILGTTAASPERVSPNDTWENKHNAPLPHIDLLKMSQSERRACFFLTLERQHVQALQAVPAGRWETAALGQTALSTAQHGSRRHDAWRGNLPHLLIQLLNLSLLGSLQGLHLGQMSDTGSKK